MTSGSLNVQGPDFDPQQGDGQDLEQPGHILDPTSGSASESGPMHPETDPEPEGLRWQIDRDDPTNPFTSHLLFSEDGEPLLWWNLGPVTVQELLAALTLVKNAQVSALTGVPAPTEPPDTPTEERRHERSGDEDRRHQPWWMRHKVMAFLLGLIGVFFLVGFMLGAPRI